MRKAEFSAILSGDELERLRKPRRTAGGMLAAALVLAMVWLSSGVDLNPDAADFGSVEAGKGDALQKVTLTNRNVTDLRPLRIALEGDGRADFRLASKACAKVNAGESCDLLVEFRPKVEGVKLASLVVYTADGGEMRTDLSGTATAPPVTSGPETPPVGETSDGGTTPPPTDNGPQEPPKQVADIHLEPTSMDFSRPNKPRQELIILNDGSGPLRLGFSLAGQNPDRFSFDASGCGASVPAGGRCSVSVSYKAKFIGGNNPLSAMLDVAHDAPNMGTPQSVPLKWERVVQPQANVSMSPGSLQFTSPAPGAEVFTPLTQTVTVRNEGPIALKNLSLRLGMFRGGENKEFTYSSHCPAALEVGQECTVTVGFNSSKPGKYTNHLYAFEGPLQSLASVDLEGETAGKRAPSPGPQPPGGLTATPERPGPVIN